MCKCGGESQGRVAGGAGAGGQQPRPVAECPLQARAPRSPARPPSPLCLHPQALPQALPHSQALPKGGRLSPSLGENQLLPFRPFLFLDLAHEKCARPQFSQQERFDHAAADPRMTTESGSSTERSQRATRSQYALSQLPRQPRRAWRWFVGRAGRESGRACAGRRS